ncbi:MAG: sulfotransferase [Candidatus Marinimicrobia bacterium]|nr:sulfotransferase [Candidatus Neomarinimicrobiota bacterium]
MNNSPILITGSHRSGSTWVGNILKQVPNVYYIHEPLTPNSITRSLFPIDIWYKYYNPKQNYEKAETVLNELFKARFPLSAVFHFKNKLPHTDYRNPGGIYDGQFDLKYTKWRTAAFLDSIKLKLKGVSENQIIPLIKDPIALTAAEWLYNTWNSRNVILIRHPAAFVSSLNRLDWRFNFENFSKQPQLMNRFLEPFRSQIENPPTDSIEEAALVWNCLTAIIFQYQKFYSDWIFIRHEDLSYEPFNQYKILFEKLELPFTKKVETTLLKTTSSQNPSDVKSHGTVHALQRDSKANVTSWKKRLSEHQIALIRDMTGEVASHFYSDDEW